MKNWWDGFARLIRIKYAFETILGSSLLCGTLWLHDYFETKRIKEILLTDCLLFCSYEKDELGIIDIDNPKPEDFTKQQCIDSCYEEYGNGK